jgi:hypothetical protein
VWFQAQEIEEEKTEKAWRADNHADAPDFDRRLETSEFPCGHREQVLFVVTLFSTQRCSNRRDKRANQ